MSVHIRKMDKYWPTVRFIDVHRCSLMSIDVHWCVLMFINVHWCWLMLVNVDWCWLMFIEVLWCSLLLNIVIIHISHTQPDFNGQWLIINMDCSMSRNGRYAPVFSPHHPTNSTGFHLPNRCPRLAIILSSRLMRLAANYKLSQAG